MSNVITVKVIRVPGAVTEVGLEEGATVADALSAASLTMGEGEAVKLNGSDTTMDATVSDGSRLIVAKAAKGA